MLNLKVETLNHVLAETPDLLCHGEWLCLNIDTKTAWPTKPQMFSFEGHDLWVMPVTSDSYPGLGFNKPAALDRDEGFAILHRALSVLAWLQDSGAVVVHMSGGNLPRMMRLQKSFGHAIRDDFDLSDLPIINHRSGSLALALVREGRGLNHAAYSFLSFYRAFEVAIPKGTERGPWISNNIDNIVGHRAQEALKKLKNSVPGDIGTHLVKSRRQAIAHAAFHPIINPDNPRDARQLTDELPIIEALAILAMQDRLGIQSRDKILQEHLYELRGWKEILTADLVEASLLAEPEGVEGQIDLPAINFRLRRSDPFTPLENMKPIHIALTNQRVELVYQSEDGLAELIFWLNFLEERLEFDLDRSFTLYDDGSVNAAQNGKERCKFIWDYFGNGEIQIWNSQTNSLISRVGGFMPGNRRANRDVYNSKLAEWDKLIFDRQQAQAGTVGS